MVSNSEGLRHNDRTFRSSENPSVATKASDLNKYISTTRWESEVSGSHKGSHSAVGAYNPTFCSRKGPRRSFSETIVHPTMFCVDSGRKQQDTSQRSKTRRSASFDNHSRLTILNIDNL